MDEVEDNRGSDPLCAGELGKREGRGRSQLAHLASMLTTSYHESELLMNLVLLVLERMNAVRVLEVGASCILLRG